MASSSDKFIKTVQAPPSKLAGPIGPDTETIPLQTLEGWSSTTAVVVAIDRYDDATGEITPSKTEIVVGTLGPNGLENVERGVGGTRQNHSDGAVAEISIAAGEQWNRAMDALIGALGQDGKIKGEMIVPGSVGPEQITPSSIGPEQLALPELKSFYATNSSTFSTSSTTLTTKMSIDEVPAGKYMAIATVVFANDSSGANGECNVAIYNNTESIGEPVQTAFLTNMNYSSTTNTQSRLITLTKTSTIQVRTSVNWPARGIYNTYLGRAMLSLIRVA